MEIMAIVNLKDPEQKLELVKTLKMLSMNRKQRRRALRK